MFKRSDPRLSLACTLDPRIHFALVSSLRMTVSLSFTIVIADDGGDGGDKVDGASSMSKRTLIHLRTRIIRFVVRNLVRPCVYSMQVMSIMVWI